MSMTGNKKFIFAGIAGTVALAIAYLFYNQSKSASSKDKKSIKKRVASQSGETILEPTTPTPEGVSPTNQSLSQSDPKYWTDKAKVAVAASDWKSAAKFWTEAIARKADYRYYTNRSAALLNVNRYLDAENDCRQSIKLSGELSSEPNLNALLNLAKALHAQGGAKLEESLKTINQVINQSKDAKSKATATTLKKRIDQSIEQLKPRSTRSSVSQSSGSTVTVNLDGPAAAPSATQSSSTQSLKQSITQPTVISFDDIPPPAFRRQDTEEDLANMDQDQPTPSSHPQTIEEHDHVFPANKPPISFAEIVKHEPVEQPSQHSNQQSSHADSHQQSKEQTKAQSNDQSDAPSVPAVVSPVPAPVMPHGSFAAVVAHAEEVAHEEEQHSNDQSSNQFNMSDSLDLIAQSEADEAVRHRDLARAETNLLTRQAKQESAPNNSSTTKSNEQSTEPSEPVASSSAQQQSNDQSSNQSTAPSTNSLSVPEVHDDLTSSGVLVNESDVNDTISNEEPVDNQVSSQSSNQSNNQSSTKPANVVPQTVLPLAGSWNKQPNTQSTPTPSEPIKSTTTESVKQVTKPVQSITTPGTPKRTQRSPAVGPTKPQSMDASPVQKKKLSKKPSNNQSQSNSTSSSNSPTLTPQAVRSPPAGPTPVEVQAPTSAGGKSWASLIKK